MLQSQELSFHTIESEFKQRMRTNPRYSLRAFAKSLGISHSLLSLILSGKRKISKNLKSKLISKGIITQDGASSASTESEAFQQLKLDQFEFISDWQHYAILSLLENPKATLNPKWIAEELGITPPEARVAISRIQRLKLIALKNGRWKQCSKPLKVENTVSTAATRKHHQHLLNKAEESLLNDDFETRDFSGITFAMSEDCIPYAREKIRAFRRSLVKDLESRSTSKKRVYELSVQIFPLSGRKNGNA